MRSEDSRRWSWRTVVLVFLAAATVASIIATRAVVGAEDTQQANIFTTLIALVGGSVVWLWAVTFSGWSGRVRLGLVAGMVVAVGAVVLLFMTGSVRFSKMTGNLVPVFAWGPPPVREIPTVGAGSAAERLLQAPDGAAASPQFFGLSRDGRVPGVKLATDWERTPPEELWRRPVGAGWSGFAVFGRCAVTQEQYEQTEVVACYDLLDGSPLWVHRDEGERHWTPPGGLGPRATPTIADGVVYTLGATGILNALTLATGELRWRVDLAERFDAPEPEWGFTSSPLVDEDRLLVACGGKDPADGSPAAVVALARDTGETVWASGKGPVKYASPARLRLCGVDQIVVFNTEIQSFDPVSGELLWTYAWEKGRPHPHVALPARYRDSQLIVSTGYGRGAECLELEHADGWKVIQSWSSRRFKAKFSNFVVHGDSIFGFDDGSLACVDATNGKRRWRERGSGHGQLLLIDDQTLVVTTEDGAVLLVEPNPERYVEQARLQVVGQTWNPPTLAGRFLLLRSDTEAVCLRLPVAE